MADPEDPPHPQASSSTPVEDPHPQASSTVGDPHAHAFSVPPPRQAFSVPPHPPAFSVRRQPQVVLGVPVDPPHPQPQASSVHADPPHPRGRFFTLSTRVKKNIPLHGSIVAILLFHTIYCFTPYSTRYMPLLLSTQIVAWPVVACLFVFAPARQAEKIVSFAFLGALTVILDVLQIVNDYCWLDCSMGCSYGLPVLFTANIVALSLYCLSKLYPVAEPWLLQYFVSKLYPFARPCIQYCTARLYPIAKPWLRYLPRNITFLLVHGIIIAVLLLHIILAQVYHDLTMQILAYPAIVCLYIWAPSGWREKIVSGAFLAALAIIVVLISIAANALFVETMYVANILALSSYCIWKLYLAAKPWLHQYHRFLEREEETGLLLPLQATFRVQDLPLPRRFSPGEVRAMTQGFRTMVGQGGFAQVFRGLLDDGTAVAVKRIASIGDGEDDFLREISVVANVHHRSLVRLLGYCLQRGGSDRYLVYPFFDGGSLDSWLFHGGEERRRLLPWPARRCIAVDVARALAYLHHECHQQILHLDIKPGNILLDGDLRAHVSDFGISMSITRDLSNVDTRGRGTPGYMAPEMMINAVSAKSDVFSYGMTLLELVGGRRNFEPSSSADAPSATPDFTRDFFPYIVREKMARGELMEAVDAAMALVDQEEVEAVVKVALSCIQSRWDMRPSMLMVVDMLEGRVATDLPPDEIRRLSTVNFSDQLSSSLTHGR